MKLFRLEIKEHLMKPSEADRVGYSEYSLPRGYMIAADSEARAREIAARDYEECSEGQPWWQMPEHTTCEEAAIDNEGILLRNLPTG